ncbi:TauD/TfdA family dioxygenase [Streptomyces sp. Cmuel-A718b]|uniref:TauD/TfdA family dioxygenase n=1 Tax=Streptomyces TaxID=1883 RepID=UPI00081F53C7|nr:TauD/TfdA family dioxygenase [Streptomyces sp. Cmuel-A718b]OSC74580.1 hypothetical protein B5180_12165 [Streptomyces sp. BF-3]SCF58557.1 gamma-butyrobetaine dioxygenase [Streptomyces sp. Cmuel-A718b]
MPTAQLPAPGVVPARIHVTDRLEAAHPLAADGAVVLTGVEPTGDGLVLAAAAVLGERLQQVFPHRLRASDGSNFVHLHADSFDFVVNVGGVEHRRRDPDEDYVLIQCIRQSDSGGDSFVADAYRFVDHCATADPELWDFLTRGDVDLYGAWSGLRGMPATPFVGRHVEYTRAGRRIVRRGDGVAPLHRDPGADHTRRMLARLEEAVHALEETLPRFRLDEGEILVLDNYRCWHGREAHTGDRAVRILTVRSSDAR